MMESVQVVTNQLRDVGVDDNRERREEKREREREGNRGETGENQYHYSNK
jgi:hypothetical protein